MDDIDEMADVLSTALAEMMTDDGPVPGSVLETIFESENQFDQLAELLVFASRLLNVSVAVADTVIGRLGDLAEVVGDPSSTTAE